jgi:exodeoxyribonuclease VII large subunit
MQGEQTETSVIQALNHIYKYVELFDVVVIIRGGGSVVDLNSFDSYELALNIANFPLPVIVGIGHERDNTVLDEVAHTSVKTPTAAAAFLIENLANELLLLNSLQDRLLDATQGRLEREMLRLDRYTTVLQGSQLRIDQQLNQLQLTEERIHFLTQMRLDKEKQTLDYMERTIQMAQPANLLKRGFSIARRNGKAIKDASQLHAGDMVETETAQGKFTSVVS